MAIIYHDPLEGLAEPEQIEEVIEAAMAPETDYAERRKAWSRLRGAIQVHDRIKGHEKAVQHMRGMLKRSQSKYTS